MNSYTLLISILSLLAGTMLTITSSHWLLAWMGLEINTLAMIPLMINQHHPRATEASTKYFLTQATASALILFSTLVNAWTTGQWELKEMTPITSNMMTVALAMKLGLAPLHFWLPEVLQGLTLMTGLILSTWQKIAPITLIIMTHNSLNTSLLMSLGLLSILIGGWTGLNQTQTRKIMAYSSIAHLGWMVTILPYSPALTTLNFLIYLMLTSTMFLTLKLMNTMKITSLTTSWPKTPTLAAMSSLTLLSLGGLPPLTGFLPKWLILHELTKQHTATIATIMAISTLLSLFFYLRLSYSIALTQSPNTTNSTTTWRHSSNQQTHLLTMMLTLSILLLPITPNILLPQT
uniref:NADH-ubiquinone oxidoreductase chain 2 n=2 Tax=Luetkenotyphlus brasiliensis TaxID=320582 RepID=W5RHC9_LUEBR|nr:NADH dehydrogenase subunit 2 [Luetkenotyphlus brasiliensis]AGZ19035.1 NADH dehydrogenase subunit 2 [Luetkenotyphlus brasiliensis]